MRSAVSRWMTAVVCVCGMGTLVAVAPGQVAGRAPADVTGSASETTITVNGTARVYRKPDYVDINIAVTSQEKTAGAANTGAGEKMSKVIEAVKKLNLEKAELQTGDVRLEPRYVSRNNGSEPQDDLLVGYRAEISLRIRTSDVNSVPRVLDAAVSAGATRIENVEFGIKEAIEAREEAIRLASQAATRKARVLAESLELRVSRIVTAGSTTQQSGGWWGRNYGNRMMAQMAGGMEQGGADGGESPVVPGQIEVWAQVDLTVAAKSRE